MTPEAPQAPQAPVKITLPVDGMTCAACQANVQRALTAAPGVAKAAVNLMTNEATIHYDPAATDPSRLVAAINDTGYVSTLPDATVQPQAADDERDRAQAREYSELRTKSLISLVLGAAAMVASMPLMPSHHAGDPLLAWTMRVFDPPMRAAAPWLYAIAPNTLSVALLAATVLVMVWAGRHFYVRAWKGLRHRTADMNTLIAIGTGAAFVYSVAATLAPGLFVADGARPDVYYEAIIIIISLVLLFARASIALPSSTSEIMMMMAS